MSSEPQVPHNLVPNHLDALIQVLREAEAGQVSLQAQDLRRLRHTLREHALLRRQHTQLLQRQQATEAVIEGTTDAVFIKDTQGRYLLVNTACALIMGRPVQQIIGKDDHELFGPEAARTMREMDQHVMAVGQALTYDEVVVSASSSTSGAQDQGPRNRLTTKAPYRDEHGRVVGVFGISRDITDRTRTEETLQDQRRFVQQILDTDPSLIFVKDPDGRFVVVNQAMANLYGTTSQALTGRLNREVLPNCGDYERYDRVDQQVLNMMRAVSVEESHICADGKVLWLLTNKLPIQLPAGGQGVLGVSTDITARKQAEQAVRDAWQRLQHHVQNSPLAVIEWDRDYRIMQWAGEAERIFGWSAQEVLGRTPDDLGFVHEEDRQRVAEQVGQMLTGESTRNVIEGRNYRKDRSVVRCQWYNSVLTDAAHRATSILSLVLDVTERQEAEERLRQANAAKDHFLAMLSHELRTPLTPVLTAAQLMEQETNLSPEQRESLAMICRNVELESRLIDDLLDVTRISRGKIELHLGAVEVHELLRRVVEMVQEEAAAKPVVLLLDSTATATRVRGDPARLQQVFWNLLKNAIKFTPAGGRITIRSRDSHVAGQPRLAVSVQDTGIGIEPLLLPQLFNAFEQGGAGVTRQFGGLGLGLTISKALVELHEGTLSAFSDGRGKGATFTVTLPVLAAAEATAIQAPQPPSAAGKTAPQPARCGHVLLVEDHADTARSMARVLKTYGFDVTIASDVNSALQAAESAPFDLVISDLGLPDGSGHDLMRQLRAGHPDLHGVALSGYGMEEDIARGREAGFAAHLTKPVDVKQLREVIDQVLSGQKGGGAS